MSLDITTWKFPPVRLDIDDKTLAELSQLNVTPEERVRMRADSASTFAKFEEIAGGTWKPGMTFREHTLAVRAEILRRRAAGDPDFIDDGRAADRPRRKGGK